jgi:prolyl-tRNA editing enzyme YbaK/EbsC (Cys-tRNA(Pro) deacylase)
MIIFRAFLALLCFATNYIHVVVCLFAVELSSRMVLASVPWFLQDLGTYGIGITPTILAAARHGDGRLSPDMVVPHDRSANSETRDQPLRSQDSGRARRPFDLLEFDAGTRTAEQASAAIGCTVAEIAKSLVFRAASGRSVLVVASGAHRVDEKKVATLVGERISRADADFVRETTGYAIGGVPPVDHIAPPMTFIDEWLMVFFEVWAAAGTPNAVFRLDAGRPRRNDGRRRRRRGEASIGGPFSPQPRRPACPQANRQGYESASGGGITRRGAASFTQRACRTAVSLTMRAAS